MAALSDMAGRIAPSATAAVAARARAMAAAGHDVIGLSVGEPDFDTPAHIREAARAAIEAGATRYTAVDGIPELKAAIRRAFARACGMAVTADRISVGTGGKQVIFNAFAATVNPGDEVVVPAPYWVSYPDMARLCGATPVVVPTGPATGFRLTPDALARVLTRRTRWLVLNSPGNPTGAVYGADHLAGLAEVLADWPDIRVLSDDIYAQLSYLPTPCATMAAAVPAMAARTLTVNGVSKAYAMTGWRIGWGAGPADLIAAMRSIQSQVTTNPCSISQWAAVAALDGPQDFLDGWRAAFQARRDRVVAALSAIPGLVCPRPDGAFYVFADIAGCLGRRSPAGTALADDIGFCTALLDETGVALVPGSAFGAPGHVRLSFAAAQPLLDAGCDRIAAFCAGLG
jgi:aspartate aminotransferase